MGCCESSEVVVLNHPTQPAPPLFYVVNADNKEECCICLEKMENCTYLPCTHKIHNECAVKWFQEYRNDECPLCRINIFTDWNELLENRI